MNYEGQRMTLWREEFGRNHEDYGAEESAALADFAVAEFDKRFAPKIDPLPELTK